MFARQISLELDLGVGDKHAIARMLTQVGEATYPPTYSPAYLLWPPTQVVKLALKTLVETVRLGTYSRHASQQLQVDCAHGRGGGRGGLTLCP